MQKYILFYLIIFGQCAFAQVQFNPSKQILLRGKSCAQIQPFAQFIFDWTTSLNQADEEIMPECYCSKDDCHIDVAPISPAFVKEVTNYDGEWSKATFYNGPNCFNAALVSSQTLANINFTHPSEMSALLKSSLCQERNIEEQPKAGDLLIVRNQKDPFFEIHAAVYLDERLSFSKYGESSSMLYSYGLDVAQSYGVKDTSCLRIKGVPIPGEHCYQKPFVNIFSCRPFYSYISQILKSSDGLNLSVQKVYAKVSVLDKEISDIVFRGDRANRGSLEMLQKDLETIFQKANSTKRTETLNTQNQELIRLLRFRIFSLFEQTRRIAKELGEEDLAKSQLSP